MAKPYLIIALPLLILFNSCVQKQENILAIGVVLTVPQDVYDQSVELNRTLLDHHPNNITLDDKHIPHITLMMGYVQERDLPKVEQVLKGLDKTADQDSLWADELQYNKGKTESFASIGINRSQPLMALHKQGIALVKPYLIPTGSQEAYVQNTDGTPIDDFTVTYVPKFVADHSLENYNPHISLGVANTSLLDSLAQHTFRPGKFRPTSISLYQLGASGTAQKLLWKSK